MRKAHFATALLALAGGGRGDAAPTDDPFAENIRTTEPRTPEEEAKSFTVPPGFEMRLFAAEPDIGKPVNMAFDRRGRLWVTESREYPFAAPADRPGRDAIRILEDTDGDGRADRITTFADGLNIPIGVLPYRDGAIAWSIPNIWHVRDTDGDGRADRREVLYGPLGWQEDTHGMSSSYRRGFDGWMYVAHGYENESVVRGRDGSRLEIESGNTYRVRLDGSRVEPHAFGQVNPFGAAFDPLGHLYTADSHSRPITLVMRGATYPSFSKPHDGMGFGPNLMEHSHESTAIAGLAYCADDLWPAEFRNNVLVGNVVTSRVNRDRLEWQGSTPTAIEQPDLVTTTDPWFRPVDLQFGPDGALYIADFYNRIIGHYEVPLDHPGRDRERGRIWRLGYRGAATAMRPRLDLATAPVDTLAAELASPSLDRRMAAMHEMSDRGGPAVVRAAARGLAATDARVVVHSLWVAHRLRTLGEGALGRTAAHPSRDVRTHAMRVLGETTPWNAALRRAAQGGLRDPDAFVRRAAADAVQVHPHLAHTRPVLAALAAVHPADTHLRHALRLALRAQVAPAGHLERLARSRIDERDARAVADVALGVPTAEAGRFLADHVGRIEEPAATLVLYVRHAARHVDGAARDALVALAQERFAGEIDNQITFWKAMAEGIAQRGQAPSLRMARWGQALAREILAAMDARPLSWSSEVAEGAGRKGNPWQLETLKSSDGDDEATFVSGRSDRKQRGVLRSPPFVLPARMRFFFAGEDGKKKHEAVDPAVALRLRDERTGAVLAEWAPPRNRTAQRVEWQPKTPPAPGTRAVFELVDTTDGNGWLALGRLDPPVVALPEAAPAIVADRLAAMAGIARVLLLVSHVARLGDLIGHTALDLETKAALARALQAVKPDDTLDVLLPVLAEPALPVALRQGIAARLTASQSGESSWRATIAQAMRTAPRRVQTTLAQALASSPAGAELLLELAESGRASPRLVQDRGVRERLEASRPARLSERTAALVAALAPASAEIDRLLGDRRAGFSAATARAEEGAKVFARACAPCHRIGTAGGLVGPQLDGIGARGLERILEDVLDPSRNVEQAFRAQYLTLASGEVLCGLPRREEGEVLVFSDLLGHEQTIPKKDIKERRDSDTSLMPDNFGEALAPEELNHLLAFLLSRTTR